MIDLALLSEIRQLYALRIQLAQVSCRYVATGIALEDEITVLCDMLRQEFMRLYESEEEAIVAEVPLTG